MNTNALNILLDSRHFATCKAKNINPQQWLSTTLQKIGNHPINRIEELLPAP
jgi:hypothetical protein